MASAASDLMTDLMAHVRRHAETAGVAPTTAEQIASCVAVSISRAWGGTAPYIPQQTALSARDQQIASQFVGDNYRALAQQYGVSERWVRVIVERARLAEIASRHDDMFP